MGNGDWLRRPPTLRIPSLSRKGLSCMRALLRGRGVLSFKQLVSSLNESLWELRRINSSVLRDSSTLYIGKVQSLSFLRRHLLLRSLNAQTKLFHVENFTINCCTEVFFTTGFISLSLSGSINEKSSSKLMFGLFGPETHLSITSLTDLPGLVPISARLLSVET